ncbi:Regulator of chromosome condensation [Escovopsis weberi]|uniref:Regulator of chromosome condensation n=1 Tax=Escovopsis weberi TaxID=150374 RepID=A0A0M8MUH0_ESCWE|nr:Regulator of chromosome condensation [Escovopsis weberi]
MELFAAGCNAWNQLSFKNLDLHSSATLDHPEEDEPHDLFSFTKVLEGREIGKPIGRLSYTIARRDGALLVSGFGLPDQGPSSLEFLSTSVETATGEALVLDAGSANPGGLRKYPSFTSWRTGRLAAPPLPCDVPVTQMAAFDTGFAVLHQDGTVSTFGDPRFESSLGRDVSPECPAHTPAPVPDLSDLDDPVTHIAAGGLCVAALTRSGAVYVWGTSSAGTHRRRQPFPSVGGVPNYVPVDGDKDVRDVALGDSHAIALTADGCVYVIGDNGNGQLGLAGTAGGEGQGQGQGQCVDVDVVKRVEEWTRVPFEVSSGSEVVGVAAGPKASFIITSRKTEASQAS